MKYLLDVNALIAFGVIQHQFHQHLVDWVALNRGSVFLTTPITEIGFVRVVANVPAYRLNVLQAKSLLLDLKENPDLPLTFLTDGTEISHLPDWVRAPSQITDGHLLQLATTHGATLATLDKGIPGALLIP
jgi:predicted nucleic acid-binding protein